MNPLDEIHAERQRQIEKEGWTQEHDDQHEDGELMRAGMIYLHYGTKYSAPIGTNNCPSGWPWEPQWWKPKDRRRNLIRAGALFMAERERKLRQNPRAYVGHIKHKLDLAVKYLNAEDADRRIAEARE